MVLIVNQLLLTLFESVDDQIGHQVDEVRHQGGLVPSQKEIFRIVGQTALLVASLPFDVTGTIDLDLTHTAPYAVTQLISKKCLDIGLVLETDQHLIWMPDDTIYHAFFTGTHISVVVAAPLYVIASKCKFKRLKDKRLIETYFQHFPNHQQTINHMGISTSWINH